jgi:hypothetical protein
MPSWNELLNELEGKKPDAKKTAWLKEQIKLNLGAVSRLRGDTNVMFYASAFLQKRAQPQLIQLTLEEINGFMSVMYGMDFKKPLTLMLHTPGGDGNAAQSVVAYLRSKFPEIEVIVPVYAFSAGTMISLAADRIVMGRQSQLGPIDPQMSVNNQTFSARSIVDQFELAKKDIAGDPAKAFLWGPLLQSLGPALLQEARNALAYGERMVKEWLETYMFRMESDPNKFAATAAKHFNDASLHKSHGRRIDRDEARSVKLRVEDLEESQELQEGVLTAYHVLTLLFEKSPATKIICSDRDRVWLKNEPQPPLQRKAGS